MKTRMRVAPIAFLALVFLLPHHAWADNVATRWVVHAFDAVRSGIPGIHTGTPGAGRTYAMVTVAMYDAVNGIDRAAGTSDLEPALVASDGTPAAGDRTAAAAAAAHAVLSALFPGRQAVLDTALAAELAGLDDPMAAEAGRAWGQDVGEEVVFLRSNDGTKANETQAGGTGPGVFPRPFTGAQFRNMTLFGISSITPYLSPGPPPLSSEEYAADFNEVKALGSLTDTDPERTAIARHWLAEGGTVRETGLSLKAALNVVEDQGTVDSLSDTVRLFALLGIGIADAVKVSWTDKFDHHFWRPGDAIRNASTDGNNATEEDPSVESSERPCTNPPTCSVFGGTPEHTSGTSTFAGAASTILAGFYCRDDIAFSFVGEQSGSQARSYDGFKEAAREAGRSRIYGGIHFQFSNDAGREAGKGIAKEILRTRLVPEGLCPGSTCVCLLE